MTTPRLAILAPAHDCGKMTLLHLLSLLCYVPFRSGDVSPPRSITRLMIIQARRCSSMKLIITNDGHRRGGNVARYDPAHRRTRTYSVFSPLAVAAIGATADMPRPLISRSIIIAMQRFAPSEQQPRLKQLDETDRAFPAARNLTRQWAMNCRLASYPEMPPSLRHNRMADNWRVLFAIADDLGHGEEARAAAIELCAGRTEEDVGILLLTDIRTVFTMRGCDRIGSAVLIESLLALGDGFWSEWRGKKGDRPPHKLTQAELGDVLGRFEIRSKSVWPLGRGPGDKSAKGYSRDQFENAWRAYCQTQPSPAAGTPAHTSKVISLPRPKGGTKTGTDAGE